MPALATAPDSLPNKPLSTRSLLLGIWCHLSKRRRIQLGLLFFVMLASGGAELVSLGTVLPFLGVLSAPEQLWQQPLVQALAMQAGFMEPVQLLLPATVAFALAAVLASLVRLTNLWLNGRLAAAIGSDLDRHGSTRYQHGPQASLRRPRRPSFNGAPPHSTRSGAAVAVPSRASTAPRTSLHKTSHGPTDTAQPRQPCARCSIHLCTHACRARPASRRWSRDHLHPECGVVPGSCSV